MAANRRRSSTRPGRTASGRRTTGAQTKRARSATATRRGTTGRRRGGVVQKRRWWNYPRANKGPIMRWLPSWRFLLTSTLAGIALIGGALTAAYLAIRVPQPSDFALAQSTTVTYADEQTTLGSYAEVRRQSVALKDLPDYVGHAVIASEDRRFYDNPGVDLKGIARAAINNLRGKPRQGGSTLTQQYVERYYIGETTSIPGKIKEALLAIKIDRRQDKDVILENYLNTIYFGRGTYGIEKAAQAYFGVSAKDLSLEQAIMLAGIIPAPGAWDPAVNPERAEQRFNRVKNLMVEDGWISAEQAAAAKFPQTIPVNDAQLYAGPRGYLLREISNELIASGQFTEEQIRTGGYTIVSSIDQPMQAAAEAAVANLPADRPANNSVGLISVEPGTGAVKAMYGGPDFLTRERNAVTQDHAQGGSTFKTFALAAALDSGITLADRFDGNTPYITPDGTKFENYDGRSWGQMTLLDATIHSTNTAYIHLNEKITARATREMAIKLGIPEDSPGLDDSLSNTLGSASVRPWDMARAYSTIAAEGMRPTLHLVTRVLGPDGEVVYAGPTRAERVISADVANAVTHALTHVVGPGGTAAKADRLGLEIAGKTGTSTGPVSAWFAGYTPNLVTVVDMYQVGPNGEEEVITPFGGTRWIQGGAFPLDIWIDYMSTVGPTLEPATFAAAPAELIRAPRPPDPAPDPSESESESEPEEASEQPTDGPADNTDDGANRPSPNPTPSSTPSPSEGSGGSSGSTPSPSPSPTSTEKPSGGSPSPSPSPSSPRPSGPGPSNPGPTNPEEKPSS